MSITLSRANKPDKCYSIDPDALKKGQTLGFGTTGNVIKAKCSVEACGKKKEVEYAFKVFNSFLNECSSEFNCHQTIIERLEQYRERLIELGITVGTGIEKKPLFTFQLEDDFMMKKLYDKTLTAAIQEGCFEDPANLLFGAKQLLEGILSLVTIGALYFDLKSANILVGRGGKLEVALTDFERISFLNFDAGDDVLIKDIAIRMPPFLAHEQELKELQECRKKISAQEFCARLHSLYRFALGAVFFEMSTKMSLRLFILIHFFTEQMRKDGASEACIQALWTQARKVVSHKEIGSLIDNVDQKYRQDLFGLINHTSYPDLELLQEVQQGIREEMSKNGSPEDFIQLVAGMLQVDSLQRTSISQALSIMQKKTS